MPIFVCLVGLLLIVCYSKPIFETRPQSASIHHNLIINCPLNAHQNINLSFTFHCCSYLNRQFVGFVSIADCTLCLNWVLIISILLDIIFVDRIPTILILNIYFEPRVARGWRYHGGSINCYKLAFNCQSSHKTHLTRPGITGSYYSEKQTK